MLFLGQFEYVKCLVLFLGQKKKKIVYLYLIVCVTQAVPLFLSEIAPTRIRGALNILFQLNITIGILIANLINYGTSR